MLGAQIPAQEAIATNATKAGPRAYFVQPCFVEKLTVAQAPFTQHTLVLQPSDGSYAEVFIQAFHLVPGRSI